MKSNATLAFALVGCIHLPHVDPLPRTELERALTAVDIEVDCGGDPDGYAGRASGVVISERHILTAAHAVACSDIPEVHATIAGQRLRVVVTREDGDADIARLEIMAANNFGLGIAPPMLVRAQPGEELCTYKGKSRTCGSADWQGIIARGMATGPGDSGAPVYTSNGNLVGIVIAGNGKDTRFAPVDASWLSGT